MTESEIEQAESALEPWAAAMHRVLMPGGKLALGVIWPAPPGERVRFGEFATLAEVRVHLTLSDTRR